MWNPIDKGFFAKEDDSGDDDDNPVASSTPDLACPVAAPRQKRPDISDGYLNVFIIIENAPSDALSNKGTEVYTNAGDEMDNAVLAKSPYLYEDDADLAKSPYLYEDLSQDSMYEGSSCEPTGHVHSSS